MRRSKDMASVRTTYDGRCGSLGFSSRLARVRDVNQSYRGEGSRLQFRSSEAARGGRSRPTAALVMLRRVLDALVDIANDKIVASILD